jgi:hypothetical protein
VGNTADPATRLTALGCFVALAAEVSTSRPASTSVVATVRMGIGSKSGWIGAETGGYPLPKFSSNSPEQLGHRATSRSLRSGKSALAAQVTQPGHSSITGSRFVREFGSCVFVVHSDQQLSSDQWRFVDE